MLNKDHIKYMWQYALDAEPICIISSSPCTGLAGWASLNRVINPEAFQRSRSVSVPLGNLAGQLALHQLHDNRHFICARGCPMPKNVVRAPCDMCAAGLKCRATGLLIKKPTELWASGPVIVREFRPLQCNQRNEHARLRGTYQGEARTHLSRTRAWGFIGTHRDGSRCSG